MPGRSRARLVDDGDGNYHGVVFHVLCCFDAAFLAQQGCRRRVAPTRAAPSRFTRLQLCSVSRSAALFPEASRRVIWRE